MSAERLIFFFDFASPYAYFAFEETAAIATEAGLGIDFRPAMVWTILKAQGISAPLETAPRRRYLIKDMARTAAFHGLPYRQPDLLPISAHLASRMWLGFAAGQKITPLDLARAIYKARFVDGIDIRDPDALCKIAQEAGHDPERARAFMDDPVCHDALAANIDDAIRFGVPGIPCVLLGDQMYFGADRLPHLRWQLDLPQMRTSATTS